MLSEVYGLTGSQMPVVSAVALLLLVLGAARMVMHTRMQALIERHFRAAGIGFRALMVTHMATWGALCVLTQHWAPARPMQTLMLVTAAASIQGAVSTMSFDRFLRLAFPLAGIVPVVISSLILGDTQNLALAFLCVVLMGFVIPTSRVVHDDYWTAQFARLKAEERAQELERISRTDALTQIPNRLHFNERLAIEWARARREGQSIAVAMLDLDHFKKINDTHGHQFGDECLRTAAKVFSHALLRPMDLVVRYGGEEFVVLMPGADLAGACVVAERLAQSLRQTPLTHEGQPVGVTCSIGVHAMVPTRHDHDPRDMEQLLKCADQALYQAKSQGRNRVSTYDASPDQASPGRTAALDR